MLELWSVMAQLLSELLSCISAMFVVVLDCPEALNPILQKIFSALSTGKIFIFFMYRYLMVHYKIPYMYKYIR